MCPLILFVINAALSLVVIIINSWGLNNSMPILSERSVSELLVPRRANNVKGFG